MALKNLKELRKNLGLTQKEIASALKISTTCYAGYEQEYRAPDIETIIKLADFFDCSVDYLMGRTDDFGNITVSPGQLTDQLNAQEKELLDAFNLLGPFERDGILVQVKALAKMNNKNLIKK